jgi:hypothetical protein
VTAARNPPPRSSPRSSRDTLSVGDRATPVLTGSAAKRLVQRLLRPFSAGGRRASSSVAPLFPTSSPGRTPAAKLHHHDDEQSWQHASGWEARERRTVNTLRRSLAQPGVVQLY